jgi:hypothetical protein
MVGSFCFTLPQQASFSLYFKPLVYFLFPPDSESFIAQDDNDDEGARMTRPKFKRSNGGKE